MVTRRLAEMVLAAPVLLLVTGLSLGCVDDGPSDAEMQLLCEAAPTMVAVVDSLRDGVVHARVGDASKAHEAGAQAALEASTLLELSDRLHIMSNEDDLKRIIRLVGALGIQGSSTIAPPDLPAYLPDTATLAKLEFGVSSASHEMSSARGRYSALGIGHCWDVEGGRQPARGEMLAYADTVGRPTRRCSMLQQAT